MISSKIYQTKELSISTVMNLTEYIFDRKSIIDKEKLILT